MPDDVVRLLTTSVDSAAELEVILLLRRKAGRAWTAKAVASELYLNPAATGCLLDALCDRGFLAKQSDPAEYRYGPSSPALASTLDKLAEVYAERRVAVISFIYARPDESLRRFSEAFRLRKDK